jgi:DNA topoisomerase-1
MKNIEDSEDPDEVQEPKKEERWIRLIHNGMYFPPFQKKWWPNHIKLIDQRTGRPFDLDSTNINNQFNMSAEEAAFYFAKRLEQDQRVQKKADETFRENFWNDWKIILDTNPNNTITSLEDVDFIPVITWIASKEKPSREEKQREEEKKEKLREHFGYAYVTFPDEEEKIPIPKFDGENPGLFIGHTSPLRGKIKKRLLATDVTLNVSVVPDCTDAFGEKCRWKPEQIVQIHNESWVAKWINPVTGKFTYMYYKRGQNRFVIENDKIKFEKAVHLGNNIDKIRAHYIANLSSENEKLREMATAIYLLDKTSIRSGAEKDTDTEADTRGLTTLTNRNIEFSLNYVIKLQFVGKSSMKFDQKYTLLDTAFKNLLKLANNAANRARREGLAEYYLFPNVNQNSLNEYLKTLQPDLTAKVFRTYKASCVFQEKLDEIKISPNASLTDKKLAYQQANMQAAIALNHQKLSRNNVAIQKKKEKITKAEEELRTGIAVGKSGPKKLTARQITSRQELIKKAAATLEVDEKEIALSTSSLNYIDPRITVSWCKRVEMPIEKIYTKTALEKFSWAMNTLSVYKQISCAKNNA